MFRLTIKELVAKKLRLLSTAMAVLLGVAFLAGTLVLTDTVTKTFDSVLADANAGTDAYVRGDSPLDLGFGEARPRIDAALVDALRHGRRRRPGRAFGSPATPRSSTRTARSSATRERRRCSA